MPVCHHIMGVDHFCHFAVKIQKCPGEENIFDQDRIEVKPVIQSFNFIIKEEVIMFINTAIIAIVRVIAKVDPPFQPFITRKPGFLIIHHMKPVAPKFPQGLFIGVFLPGVKEMNHVTLGDQERCHV